MLAILAAFTFAFMPALAGDHPWNEDESGGNAGDGGEPDNGGTSPDDPFIIDPENLDTVLGSALFWWDIIRQGITSEDKTESVTADKVNIIPETPSRGGRSHR